MPNLKQLSSYDVIDTLSELYYSYNTSVDPSVYPHIHDFYELTLVVEGCQEVVVNNTPLTLEKNSLFFLRPGDIHLRSIPKSCTYIIISILNKTMRALWDYMGLADTPDFFMNCTYLPVSYLDDSESIRLQQRIQNLTLITSSGDKAKTRMALRTLVLDIVMNYFYFNIYDMPYHKRNVPQWLNAILDGLKNRENIIAGIDYIHASCTKTPEHICRSFKKYLDITPSEYVNSLRLKMAIDLLAYTSQKVGDIAFEVGFSNPSIFFRLFKESYGITPRHFRNYYLQYVSSKSQEETTLSV